MTDGSQDEVSSAPDAAFAPTVFAAALAAVAGAVDAVCFDRVFGVFPANQSGNAVLLGIGLGAGHGSEAWKPALAIVGFAVGVTVALVLGRRLGDHRPVVLLTVEVVALLPLAVVLLDASHPRSDLDDPATAVLLLLTTAAMGIQTEVIGRAAGVAVATTYQSGAIVRIAELLANGTKGRRRLVAERGIVVLLAVLAAYVGGAALGAALGSWSAALFVPIALLVAVAVIGIRAASSIGTTR